MKTLHMLISFVIVTLEAGKASNNGQCESPQYIELSTCAVIKCHFDGKAFAILWFNSSDYSGEPFLYFKDDVKSGIGVSSGEFDVKENGSLIIHNVSLVHDHYFTAVKLNTSEDDLIPHRVRAIVSVTPSVNYPLISKCRTSRSVCYVELNENESLSCAIRGSRPAIPLQWISKTAHGDINVTSNTDLLSEGIIFSTFASVNRIFSSHSNLLLLVCKATSHTPFLSFHESMILVKNKHGESLISSSVIETFQYNTEVKLTCSVGNSSFLVWKIKHDENEELDVPLAIFINSLNITEILLSGYHVDDGGSLIIPKFKLHQEGVYHCLNGNGLMSEIQRHQVIAYVPPVPQHPVVDGCLNQDYCKLETVSEGQVTCRLFGIRPEVHLEWYTFPQSMSSKLIFSDHSRERSNKDGLYDIVLTAKYLLKDLSYHRVTVECKGSLENEPLIHFSTKVDLIFVNGLPGNETAGFLATYNHLRWVIPTVIIFYLFTVLLAVVLIKTRVRRNRKERRQTVHREENLLMMNSLADKEQMTEFKAVFIKEITAKYEEMCAAVQPVPFIRGRLLNIEKVYVNGGMKYLHRSNNQFGNEIWEHFDLYSDIFTDKKLRSKRYIIEAEAGYGKTTLCLQLVHEWYSKDCSSSIRNFDLLIFLRLRQMKEGMSIFHAVRQTLLPQDSQLSEKDVRSIILSCESVLIVLDGFDECINNYYDAEVTKIMAREIFQSFDVVLTTRPSCLPKAFSPQTTRIRLTGFDDIARDNYISKAVVNRADNDVQLLKCRLCENPVLKDLCENPLFFVMFAHLTHEKEEVKHCVSVTSFFRYSVSCIYAHARNKDSKHYSSSTFCDHSKLNQLAFDSLAIGQQQQETVWEQGNVTAKIGKETLDTFLGIGMLSLDENCIIADGPQLLEVRYIKKVRFCHDVFREWYAAHFLAKICSETDDLPRHLNHHDPSDFEYMFRFACGLDPIAGVRIINHFKKVGMSNEKVILCVIENTGSYTKIVDTVKDVCSRAIDMRQADSRITQRATKLFLEIAYQNRVEISCLRFWNCFTYLKEEFRNSGNDIRKLLPVLKGIACVNINEENITFDSSAVETILTYVSTCKELKILSFFYCLMPMCFKAPGSTDFQVSWYTKTYEWYNYDFTSNQWKKRTKHEDEEGCYMTQLQYEKMIQLFEGNDET